MKNEGNESESQRGLHGAKKPKECVLICESGE